MFKNIFKILFFFLSLTLSSESKNFNNIIINGNERISDETILVFSELSKVDFLDENSINLILKKLYQSGFFKDVIVRIENKDLIIEVSEKPIIQSVVIEGIKKKKSEEEIYKLLSLKDRSSFNTNSVKQDEIKIINYLKGKG